VSTADTGGCCSLKTRTDAMKLDRFKSHGYIAFRKKPKVWADFRLNWLRSEDLKEEQVMITSLLIIPVRQKVT
jgi:hypothetical protein